MAHFIALVAFVLAGAVSPEIATAREFMDGAAGHCLLCDFFGKSKVAADADCDQSRIGAVEQSDEQADDVN
ncbi:MAG: hypothetical protein FJX45_05450 [Alphaproteobacteria bacterium]|nr:hypothetical protein [Alphaproteobacteria bacterium]MBM3651930.1 hypothetical protein [Alphaproteobacteria bacterium]